MPKVRSIPTRDVGMVFQQALLLKWRTILDNVLLPAEIVGLPIKAARERAHDLLNLVGLAGYEEKYPQQLSGGYMCSSAPQSRAPSFTTQN